MHHPEFLRFFGSTPSSGVSQPPDDPSCLFPSSDIFFGLLDGLGTWQPDDTPHSSISVPASNTGRYRTPGRTIGIGSGVTEQRHGRSRTSLRHCKKPEDMLRRRYHLLSFRLFAETHLRSPKVQGFGLLLPYMPSITTSLEKSIKENFCSGGKLIPLGLSTSFNSSTF
mgnify:CR=1 FL=1